MRETEEPMVVNANSRGERISVAEYGSDLVVEMLRQLEIPYVAMNPGASFRGLHDSFVNFPGEGPELIQCCHEEIAVAVALGYARATGKPMAAALHSMVGLQHGQVALQVAQLLAPPRQVVPRDCHARHEGRFCLGWTDKRPGK